VGWVGGGGLTLLGSGTGFKKINFVEGGYI